MAENDAAVIAIRAAGDFFLFFVRSCCAWVSVRSCFLGSVFVDHFGGFGVARGKELDILLALAFFVFFLPILFLLVLEHGNAFGDFGGHIDEPTESKRGRLFHAFFQRCLEFFDIRIRFDLFRSIAALRDGFHEEGKAGCEAWLDALFEFYSRFCFEIFHLIEGCAFRLSVVFP